MSLTLSATQRRRLRELIPPQLCSATSKQTGGPCQRYAIPGASVCKHHGGAAPQTRALADRKVALSLALAEGGPGKSAPAVLVDALAVLDRIAQDAKHGLIQDPGNPALAAELAGAYRDAASLAKALVDLGISGPGVEREHANALTFVLQVAAADLGLTLSDARVGRAMGAAFRELDALGPVTDERAAAVERVVSRLERDRETREAAERDRQAAAAAELRTAERKIHMAELKRAQRVGRPCDVCGIAAPAVKAIGGSAPLQLGPGFDGSGPGSPSDHALSTSPQNRSERAGVPDSDQDNPVLTGELLPADPRRCPGCHGDRNAPGHDQQCGYATATTDPTRGRPWIS